MNLGVTLTNTGSGITPAMLAKVKSLGVKTIRMGLNPRFTDLQHNSWQVDEIAKASVGYNLICPLAGNNCGGEVPAWPGVTAQNQGVTTDENRRLWANWAADMIGYVLRINPNTKFEIWNEPDLPQFWDKPDPSAYVALVHAVREECTARGLKPFLIGGVWSNYDEARGRDFAGSCLYKGLLPYVDGVAYHDYSPVGGMRYRLSNLYSDMADHGAIRPIFITEANAWTNGQDGKPEDRFPKMIKACGENLVDTVCIYKLENQPKDKDIMDLS